MLIERPFYFVSIAKELQDNSVVFMMDYVDGFSLVVGWIALAIFF